MKSANENDDSIREMVSQFKAKFDTPESDREIDTETGFPAPSAEQGFAKEDIGANVQGGALEPRSTRAAIEGGGFGRQLFSKAFDMTSTPGRLLAAGTAKLTGKDDFRDLWGKSKVKVLLVIL